MSACHHEYTTTGGSKTNNNKDPHQTNKANLPTAAEHAAVCTA